MTTTTDRRLVRGEQTRAEIVEAAHALFLRQGYHGTSIRQIADRAGISPGGIYNHFSGKEDIFEAVFQEHHPYHEIVPALMKAEGETAEAWIRDAAVKMLDALERRPGFLNLMLIELVEFESAHIPLLIETVAPQGLTIVRRFMEAQPNLRPIPPPILLRTFLGLFFSYYVTEQMLLDGLPPEFQENAIDHFVDVYLHGILATASSHGVSAAASSPRRPHRNDQASR